MWESRRSTRPDNRPIFLGLAEIAHNLATMAAALRDRGHAVETLVIHIPADRHFYPADRYDDVVEYWSGTLRSRLRFHWELARRFIRAIRRYRAFVYVWHFSFLPKQLDFVILRLLRKPVIVFYCGDDIRYRRVQVEIDRRLTRTPPVPLMDADELDEYFRTGRAFSDAFWSTKIAEKTRCTVVAARDSATFQGRPYRLFHFPQPRLTDEPRQASPQPLVVHAPSSSLVKGTRFVEAAVARLREEGLEFRFRLITDAPNDDVLACLREADIAIDQPGVWIGRFGAEALASGCVVIGGNQPAYTGHREASPVVQFPRDVDALTEVLRDLIVDRARREELMRDSWTYWRDHISSEAFGRFFDAVLGGDGPVLAPLPWAKRLAGAGSATLGQRLAVEVLW
jgi:hypothetical protein